MAIARRTRLNLANLTDRLAPSLTWLDKPAKVLHKAFDPVLGPNGVPIVKDALYGTWLGHPLHPMMTDLPIGFWTSSFVLDVVGKKKAADLMLKLGTVSAVGTAVTGVAQWQDLQEMKEPRRLGMLHALLNVAATSCYGMSWVLRGRKERGAAKAFSTAGFALATAGGQLGGDLSFKLGIGVSRVAFEEPSRKWRAVVAVADLEDGVLKRVEGKAGPIVLLKEGDAIHAASATCTHVGGPLDEGERDGTCVQCPWHGSVFDLRNGHVVHGPATAPLHAYETRITGDSVEVRPMPG
jgi:nitrite reductase/ring-hydroxylating ferredoxin subunit/uncharacterized membrane protein